MAAARRLLPRTFALAGRERGPFHFAHAKEPDAFPEQARRKNAKNGGAHMRAGGIIRYCDVIIEEYVVTKLVEVKMKQRQNG